MATSPTTKSKKKIDSAAELKKKKEALAKAREHKHPPGGLPKSNVAVGTDGLAEKTDEDLLDEELDPEKKKSAAENESCVKRKPKIDLEILAEKIYMRLLFEARIERERAGWEVQ